MVAFKSLQDLLALETTPGKVVLVREDLNVPMRDGQVTDDTRLRRAVPTLDMLAGAGFKVVVLAHFGRPKGQVVADMSLRPVASALNALTQATTHFYGETIGAGAQTAIDAMNAGQILVLENSRYLPGEEKNDAALAQELAALGDYFVSDAFSASHRAHVTTEGLAHHLPSFAGLLMAEELEALHKVLGQPIRPVVAIVGGSKISTKLDLLSNLIDKVDTLVIGGGMANTFLQASGVDVGQSLAEPDLAPTALDILAKADRQGCRIMLPSDVVVADAIDAGDSSIVVPATAVPSEKMILDFGPNSAQAVVDIIEQAETLIWNGPLGAFEFAPFDQATMKVAHAVATQTTAGALVSVAGGGDTVSALGMAGTVDQMTYVSSAGGAFLEWMEGKELPGVKALARSSA